MAAKRNQFSLLDILLWIALWNVVFNLASAMIDDVKAQMEAAARRSEVMPALRGNDPYWETSVGRRILESYRERTAPEAIARRNQWEQARRLRSTVALSVSSTVFVVSIFLVGLDAAREKASRRLKESKQRRGLPSSAADR